MKRVCYYLSVMIGITACSTQKHEFGEYRDNDMYIQVLKAASDSTNEYQVRIFPGKGKTDDREDLKTMMQYSIDSCFYILDKKSKIYPALLQPIANGVGNSFEYLLMFDSKLLTKRTDEVILVYQDRYITNKLYRVKLSKQ